MWWRIWFGENWEQHFSSCWVFKGLGCWYWHTWQLQKSSLDERNSHWLQWRDFLSKLYKTRNQFVNLKLVFPATSSLVSWHRNWSSILLPNILNVKIQCRFTIKKWLLWFEQRRKINNCTSRASFLWLSWMSNDTTHYRRKEVYPSLYIGSSLEYVYHFARSYDELIWKLFGAKNHWGKFWRQFETHYRSLSVLNCSNFFQCSWHKSNTGAYWCHVKVLFADKSGNFTSNQWSVAKSSLVSNRPTWEPCTLGLSNKFQSIRLAIRRRLTR